MKHHIEVGQQRIEEEEEGGTPAQPPRPGQAADMRARVPVRIPQRGRSG